MIYINFNVGMCTMHEFCWRYLAKTIIQMLNKGSLLALLFITVSCLGSILTRLSHCGWCEQNGQFSDNISNIIFLEGNSRILIWNSLIFSWELRNKLELIWIKTQKFSLKEMHLKMSSGKCLPFVQQMVNILQMAFKKKVSLSKELFYFPYGFHIVLSQPDLAKGFIVPCQW